MKRLVLGSLSVLMMSAAIAPAAIAKPLSTNTATASVSSTADRQTTPFNLVHLAKRGYFTAQGIPSYGAFLSAYRSGQITAEDIVKSAIEANRLSPDVLNDSSYLHAVRLQLDGLDDGDRG